MPTVWGKINNSACWVNAGAYIKHVVLKYQYKMNSLFPKETFFRDNVCHSPSLTSGLKHNLDSKGRNPITWDIDIDPLFIGLAMENIVKTSNRTKIGIVTDNQTGKQMFVLIPFKYLSVWGSYQK